MNKSTHGLSRRYLLLSTSETKVLGFECVKGMYAQDEDFKEIYEKCTSHAHGLFHLEHGFLFKGTQLCIPKYGFRELLIQELHDGALAGNFGIEKTSSMLKEYYYWPIMSKDVEHYVKRAPLANLLIVTFGLKAFTLHPCFHMAHGRMLAWISSLDCQGCKDTSIPSWWWWIDSQRWHTLWLVTLQMMPLILLISTSKRLCVSTVYQEAWCRIRAPSS